MRMRITDTSTHTEEFDCENLAEFRCGLHAAMDRFREYKMEKFPESQQISQSTLDHLDDCAYNLHFQKFDGWWRIPREPHQPLIVRQTPTWLCVNRRTIFAAAFYTWERTTEAFSIAQKNSENPLAGAKTLTVTPPLSKPIATVTQIRGETT